MYDLTPTISPQPHQALVTVAGRCLAYSLRGKNPSQRALAAIEDRERGVALIDPTNRQLFGIYRPSAPTLNRITGLNVGEREQVRRGWLTVHGARHRRFDQFTDEELWAKHGPRTSVPGLFPLSL